MQMKKARHDVMQRIQAGKAIAILRGLPENTVLPVVRALASGGVNVVELTTDTPGALQMIERLVEMDLDGVSIGAGTVRDPAMVRDACAAGAEFIITPMLDRAVMEMAVTLSCPIIPGVMTPSEIFAAGQAGAAAVKLFPASVLGPRFVQEVRTPLPNPPMIPTGGIGPENAVHYLQAGAFALGVGSWFLPKEALLVGNFAMLTERARTFMDAIAAVKDHANG